MVEDASGVGSDLGRLSLLTDDDRLSELELLAVVLKQSRVHNSFYLLTLVLLDRSLVQAELQPQDQLFVIVQLDEAAEGRLLNRCCVRAHLD